jgi:hypothetical protein
MAVVVRAVQRLSNAFWRRAAITILAAFMPGIAFSEDLAALKDAALAACAFDGRSIVQSMAERDTPAETALDVLKEQLPEDYVARFDAFATSDAARLLAGYATKISRSKGYTEDACRILKPLATIVVVSDAFASYGLELDKGHLVVASDIVEEIQDRCDFSVMQLPLSPVCDFPK